MAKRGKWVAIAKELKRLGSKKITKGLDNMLRISQPSPLQFKPDELSL